MNVVPVSEQFRDPLPQGIPYLPELLPGRLRSLATEVAEPVIPVRGRTVLSVGEGPALEELLLDIGRTSGGEAGDTIQSSCATRPLSVLPARWNGVVPASDQVLQWRALMDGTHEGRDARRADFVAWPT